MLCVLIGQLTSSCQQQGKSKYNKANSNQDTLLILNIQLNSKVKYVSDAVAFNSEPENKMSRLIYSCVKYRI